MSKETGTWLRHLLGTMCAVLTLFCATVAGATGFYVDAFGGNDSNPGNSPNAPWQTLGKVNSQSFSPGDVIYLKRNTYWRESLQVNNSGTSSNPITFTAYGAGSPPLISGSDLVYPWNGYSGAIYRAQLSNEPGNVFVDGGPGWGLRHAGSVGDMSAGSWSWNSGALFVWLADSSNPQQHLIDAAVRTIGLDAEGTDYIVVDGLWVLRTGGYGMYFYNSHNPVIQNNTVAQTGTGTDDQGQYYNGIHVDIGGAAIIYHNTVSYTGGHGNAINCQRANNSWLAWNNVSHFNHNGVDSKMSDGIYVYANLSHDADTGSSNGIYQEYCTNSLITNNAVWNLQGSEPGRGSGIQMDIGNSGMRIYNNSIFNTLSGMYLINSATVMNNAVNQARGPALAANGGGNIDFNDWGVNPTINASGNSYDIGSWQGSGHSHDHGSDPMWLAPSSGNFNLQQGSPCINAGTDVGMGHNGNAPDMGAVESPW